MNKWTRYAIPVLTISRQNNANVLALITITNIYFQPFFLMDSELHIRYSRRFVELIRQRILNVLLLAVAAAVIPAAAFGDQMKFLDVNGPGPGGSPYVADPYNGYYYVSPYYGQDLTTGQTNIILFCLDFNHEITVNQVWDATVHQVPLTQAAFDTAASTFQFGNVPGSGPTFVQPLPSGESVALTSWQRYQVVAHLFNKELGLLGSGMSSTSAAFNRARAVYQYAAWEVFLENNYTAGGHTYNYVTNFMASFNTIGSADAHFKNDVQSALNEALTNFSTADLNGWTVVSPKAANLPGSAQEFLSPSFPTNNLLSAPEPATIVLFGSALAIFGVVRLRRRISKS
ncbi:MAG TPA: PEP-CTERM sorting domain-containing protein [Bryobacteraceae bacterium]